MFEIICMTAGLVAGIFAVLFGVGGGAILVPVFSHLFAYYSVQSQTLMQSVITTSLSVIVCQVAMAVFAHHRANNIDWSLWRGALLSVLFGALLGSSLVHRLDTSVLHIIFAVGLIYLVVSNFRRRPHLTPTGKQVGWKIKLFSFLFAVASSLMGIGGGLLYGPYFAQFKAWPKAMGTASALTWVTAATALLSLWFWGQQVSSQPQLLWGYWHVYAWAWTLIGSFLGTYFASYWLDLLSIKRWQMLFRVFLLLLTLSVVVEVFDNTLY